MKKKLIKQLAENSFTNYKLDNSKVMEIVEKLNRRQLKEYIRQLKKYISENSITVETAFPVNEEMRKSLTETYKEKNIEYILNKELMLGIKIYENDIIFSKNLRDTLENIKNYVTE